MAVARLLRLAASTKEADALFVQIADTAARWIELNRPQILTMVEQRNRWWIPKPINRSIAEAIANGFIELLNELRKPDSEERAKLVAALVQISDDVVGSAERRTQIEALLRRAIDDPDFRAWLLSIWRGFSQSAIESAADPSSSTHIALEKLAASIAVTFSSDRSLIARVDAIAERLALIIVARRHDIAGVVDEVVRGWDPQMMSERLELVVGSDLQYIRMNGTLVGAIVGGVLFVVSRLLETAL
jgi:uncharacterized membrane-anchored protein YjiN (DUF445 family)